MRKWLLVLLWIVAGLAVLVFVVVLVLSSASRHVPEFYAQALQGDPAQLQTASREMHLRSAELASHVQTPGLWQQTFTAEQINGWLAVGRFEEPEPKSGVGPWRGGVGSHSAVAGPPAGSLPADLVPEPIKDPRVAIGPEGLRLGCRYESGRLGETVLSVLIDAYVTEQNEVAVRIREARAGAIPLPLGTVLKEFAPALRRLPCRARLAQVDRDPVVLLAIPPLGKRDELLVEIREIRFSEGRVQIAGTTKRR